MQNIFHGLGIALITPFKEDFSIDYEALVNLVNYHLDNGADFFCILATTGEVPCLSREEKNELTAVVKRVVNGRVPILKYCGGNNTAAVVEEIKTTDWSGIDGILIISQAKRDFISILRLLRKQVHFLLFCIMCLDEWA